MGAANRTINDLNEYQQLLKQHPVVIVLFTSQYCQACLGVGSLFQHIADKYADSVTGIILDTAQTPKIDNVDGTPTVVVYRHADEVENLKGIGYHQNEQKELLEDLFDLYAKVAALP